MKIDRNSNTIALLCFAMIALHSGCSYAQSMQSSVGQTPHLWVGSEYSNFASDLSKIRLSGIGIYADLPLYSRYGLEGEARFLDLTQPEGVKQKTAMLGPYATVLSHRQITADVKFTLGGAQIYFPNNIGHGSYFAYSAGGSLSYQLSKRLKVRGSYEYQFIPGAPGLVGYPDNGLNPNGFSVGISYRVF